jgi:hypothetical protein
VARLKVSANLQVLRPSEQQWKPHLRQAATTLHATALQIFPLLKKNSPRMIENNNSRAIILKCVISISQT